MVNLNRNEIAYLFDKNPDITVELEPANGWLFSLKKPFNVKIIKVLNSDLEYISDININVVYCDASDLDFDNPAAIDGEIKAFTVTNNGQASAEVAEIIVELVDDTRIFGQEWLVGDNDGVEVDDSSTLIIAANPKRKYAIIYNDADPNETYDEVPIIYLGLGQNAVVNKGPVILPGGFYEITHINMFKGIVNAICSIAGPINVSFTEGT